MPLLPHGSYRKTRGIIRRGTRANQPAANTVLEGTLYYVTDQETIERSNGTNWESYSGSGFGNQRVWTPPEFEERDPDVWLPHGIIDPNEGKWRSVPYAAGNYGASESMTWSVDDLDDVSNYCIIKKTMILSIDIISATIGGTPSGYLTFKIPGGFGIPSLCRYLEIPYNYHNNGTYGYGLFVAVGGEDVIRCYRDGVGTNWQVETNTNNVVGSITIPIIK